MSLHNQGEHQFAKANLSAYLDGELSEAEAQRVRQHVLACVECQQELATLRATVTLLQRAPMRPLPRSFVLPASAQPQQVRQRRWTATYAFMRGGMVAVTAMLILTIGVDVMFRAGFIPLTASSLPAVNSAPTYYGEPEADVEATVVVEAIAERRVEGLGGGEPADNGETDVLPTVSAEGEGLMALSAPAPEPTTTEAAMVVGMLGTEEVAAPEVSAEKSAPQVQVEAAPTSEAETTTSGAASIEETNTTGQSQALAADSTSAEPAATAEEMAARGAESLPASDDSATATLTSGWIIWQVARTLLGVLVGLLLILGAGLLWFGQKRRL